MPDYRVIRMTLESPGQIAEIRRKHVAHPPARNTPNMMVRHQVRVEPLLLAGHLQLPDQTQTGQNFQVAIHGAQTDSRHPSPHQFIDLVRRRVRPHAA